MLQVCFTARWYAAQGYFTGRLSGDENMVTKNIFLSLFRQQKASVKRWKNNGGLWMARV
jgi:hypothetical protein